MAFRAPHGKVTRRVVIALAVAVLTLGWSAPVLADPCEGALPAKQARLSGVVRYVGDGDGLCIGPEGRPDRWIEVRLSDFFAPELHESVGLEAKRRLERLVMNRSIACLASRRSYDRVIATCKMNGRPLGALLRAAGATEEGRGWR